VVTISIDNSNTIEANVTNVAVGNGRYHGGGMLSCPGAEIDDGFLDVTLIRFLTFPQLLGNIALLYNGTIHSHPKVESFKAKYVRADSDQPTLIEIDGEPLGRLPVEISVVPKTLQVLA
jgi:diacylglycerol kinase (ATP)